MMGSLSPVKKKRKHWLPGLKLGSGELITNAAALMTDLFPFVMYSILVIEWLANRICSNNIMYLSIFHKKEMFFKMYIHLKKM